jgi:hypothetical protein
MERGRPAILSVSSHFSTCISFFTLAGRASTDSAGHRRIHRPANPPKPRHSGLDPESSSSIKFFKAVLSPALLAALPREGKWGFLRRFRAGEDISGLRAKSGMTNAFFVPPGVGLDLARWSPKKAVAVSAFLRALRVLRGYTYYPRLRERLRPLDEFFEAGSLALRGCRGG